MSFVTKVYHGLFRRTSTFVLTIMVGAFAFERVFDQGADYLFEMKNKGKLYKHIEMNFQKKDEDEE